MRYADGYKSTPTFQKYGDPRTWNEQWHTMPTDDCRGQQEELSRQTEPPPHVVHIKRSKNTEPDTKSDDSDI